MADPKYADLPGIATDQPDTYETNSDRGQDTVIRYRTTLSKLVCPTFSLLRALGLIFVTFFF